MKQLSHLDFVGNQIQNALAGAVAGDPGSPANGQFWYDSSAHLWKWRANGVTVNPLARGSHTGSQLASTISDFDTQVRTNRLDQMAAPTADVNLNSRKITNVANGTGANDAVNLSQLEQVQNGTDWKPSVRVATTANITLSGTQTIDDVSVAADERVLVKNQSTGADNGLYLCKSGAWVRTADADSSAEVTPNLSVFVEEGTVNADTQWRLTTNGPITLGSTALVFGQIGAGTSYTEGNGIDIAGSVISVDTAVVVRKYAATIGDNSSTSLAVTHSLGTKDVTYSVRQVSDDAVVACDAVMTSTSVLTLSFSVAPATNALRVVVHG